MAFKFVVLAALVACANAGAILPQAGIAYSSGPALHAAPVAYSAGPAVHAAPIAYSAGPAVHAAPLHYAAAPVAKAIVTKTVDEEYDPNPQYSYSYDVHDQLTGDAKSQQETRNGDAVQGSYSLLEADGTRRIVEYTADDHNGFNAVVHKEPAAQVVKTVAAAPVAYAAAPAVANYHAPAAYAAAPAVAYKSYAAPAGASYHAPAAYAAAPALAYKSYAAPALAHY